jgi:hypothetical protein
MPEQLAHLGSAATPSLLRVRLLDRSRFAQLVDQFDGHEVGDLAQARVAADGQCVRCGQNVSHRRRKRPGNRPSRRRLEDFDLVPHRKVGVKALLERAVRFRVVHDVGGVIVDQALKRNAGKRWIAATEQGGIALRAMIFVYELRKEGKIAALIEKRITFPSGVCAAATSLAGR